MEKKRITVRPRNPNMLFKKFLRELITDAEKNKKRVSQTYQRALDSLNLYPLNLYCGHDCSILENFGPKICQMMDEKLEKHMIERVDLFQHRSYKEKVTEVQRREGLRVSDLIQSVEAAGLIENTFFASKLQEVEEEVEEHEESLKSTNSSQEIAKNEIQEINEILEEVLSSAEDSEDSIDKLIRKYDPEAAKLKKKSKALSSKATTTSTDQFKSPVTTLPAGRKFVKHKTFDSMHLAGPSYASSPISKFLDVETMNSSALAPIGEDEGDEFDRLIAKYDNLSPIPATKRKATSPVKKSVKTARLQTLLAAPVVAELSEEVENKEQIEYISVDDISPNDYDIILLVDIGETIAGKSGTSRQEMTVKLKENNVVNEVRKLNVGDFTWIARHKTSKSKEFVLPYIVERKRLDDLSSSIKDGRFHEQKFRLKQCGIENVIYLIENHVKNGNIQCGLPFTTLLQAATNTQIHCQFQVKFTENNQHTALYLTVMTSFIDNIFKNKAPFKLKLMEFEKFNQSAVKQRRCSLRETFMMQLLSFKGLSTDIALEITKFYSSPTELYKNYFKLSKSEGESLLSKITIGDLNRKIPSTVSKSIYNFYMMDKL